MNSGDMFPITYTDMYAVTMSVMVIGKCVPGIQNWVAGSSIRIRLLTRIFHRLPDAPADSPASQALDWFGAFDVYKNTVSRLTA